MYRGAASAYAITGAKRTLIRFKNKQSFSNCFNLQIAECPVDCEL